MQGREWLVHYLKALKSGFTHPYRPFLLEYIIKGKYRGKALLDIGSGPVVYPVITASEWFDKIYVSDLSIDNAAFLQKWIQGESEATESMKYVMKQFAIMDGKG